MLHTYIMVFVVVYIILVLGHLILFAIPWRFYLFHKVQCLRRRKNKRDDERAFVMARPAAVMCPEQL